MKIRPMTEADWPTIRARWVRVLAGRPCQDPAATVPVVGIGRRLNRGQWREAAEWLVDVLRARSEIKVAVWEKFPDEVLGFIAYTPSDEGANAVHMVHVFGQARRRGIGTALLGEVQGEVRATYTSEAGHGLLASLEDDGHDIEARIEEAAG